MLGICLAVSLASAPLAGCSIFGGGSRPTEPAETTAPAETAETTEAALNEESRASAGTVETLSAEEREELRKKAKELENPVKRQRPPARHRQAVRIFRRRAEIQNYERF